MCYNLVTFCIECKNYIDSVTKSCGNRRDVNLEGCRVGRCLESCGVDGFPIQGPRDLVWQKHPVAVVDGDVALYLHPIRLIKAICVWCHARLKPHCNEQLAPSDMEWQVKFVDEKLGTLEMHHPRAVRNVRKTDYSWGKDDPNEYYAYFTEGQLERWSKKYDPPLSTVQRRRLVDTVDQQVQTGHEFVFIEEQVYSQVLDLELTLEEHHHILREEYPLTHFLNHLEERKECGQIMAVARGRQAETTATFSNAVPPMPLPCPPGQDQLPATDNLQRRSRSTPFRNMTKGPRCAAPAAKPNGVQKATDRCGARAPALARNSAVVNHVANTAMAPVPSNPVPRPAVLEAPESKSPAVDGDANMQTSGDTPGETPVFSETMLANWAASKGISRDQLIDELLQNLGSGIPAPTMDTNQQPPAPKSLPVNPAALESSSADPSNMDRFFDFDKYRQPEPAGLQQTPTPPTLEPGSSGASSMDIPFDFDRSQQQGSSRPSSAGAFNAWKDISTADLDRDEENYNNVFGGGFDCSAPKHSGA